MASLQISSIHVSSFSLKTKHFLNVSKSRRMPKISTKNSFEETGSTDTKVRQKILHDEDARNLNIPNNKSRARTTQLFTILELVTDRIEMHRNVGEQRDNWNALLLNSINTMSLTAATMSGLAATCPGAGAPLLALKLSSTLLFCAATGLLLVMNKIQPSQLAEEQRNATRLFRQLQTKIEISIALGSPNSEEDVNDVIEKVLALDRAYPLPLLGAMVDKFPAKFEPVVWWPRPKTSQSQRYDGKAKNEKMEEMNGWSEELEMELREVVEVARRKDFEDYERIGNTVLKMNKSLAMVGPLLMGVATIGSVFNSIEHGHWTYLVTLLGGSLGAVVNSIEHGGQVGMVFEMYRYCGGFLRLLEETVEATLEEKDVEKRENGEVFEKKVAMQLGRSGFQLKDLASKSASCRREGIAMDEFASRLFY